MIQYFYLGFDAAVGQISDRAPLIAQVGVVLHALDRRIARIIAHRGSLRRKRC